MMKDERKIPKLTIELVPETCWFSNVRSEVSKAQWDEIRWFIYKEAGNRCEICGGKGDRHPVECHEIWHYDDANLVQTLVGMHALCPTCHGVKHFGLSQIRGLGEDMLKHLAAVNGWTVKEANAYVVRAFTKWEERSGHDWKLDLTYLKFVFGIAKTNARAKV